MNLARDLPFPGDKQPAGSPPATTRLWDPIPPGESEITFRTLVESIKDYGIFLLDIGGFVTSWNAGAQRIKGYEAGEIIGRHFSCFYPKQEVAIGKPQLDLELATAMGRVEDEGWRMRKDGSRFWANLIITAIRDKHGKLCGYSEITRDITERKNAEQKLERSHQELQNYIDSMSTFNAKVALDGTFLIVNEAARRAAGLPAEELMRTNFLEGHWFGFDPQVKARVAEAFHRACAGAVINYDEGMLADGRVITINFSLVPVRGTDGKVAYLVAEGRDITVLKRVEEALHQRTLQLEMANKELEAFSYSVSHDLRAPLRSIDGFTMALLDDYGSRLDETGAGYLRRVRGAAERMNRLIEALLKLSQLSRRELKREAVDLTALAQSIVDELKQATPERNVQVNIAPGMTVHGDAQLLRIALVNLLGNAWKFTRKKAAASIEFSSANVETPPVYFVRDNGAGFNLGYADRLFGPFQRLHEASEFEGTGIGLATVQRIISRHGGTIWAEGKPGEGATFFFALPAGGPGR